MSSDLPAVLLTVTGLIVALRTWLLVWMWKLPLAHGPGFFLGAEVGPGFHEGPGTHWLRRFRALMLTEYLIAVSAMVTVAILGRWSLVPVFALGAAALFSSTYTGFALWTRAKLRGAVPAATRLAVPLESRRLRDYLSWPAEGLFAALVVAAWVLLLTQATTLDRLRPPVVLTYLLAGCLIAKIGCIRMGLPVPSERAAEHHRWFDAHRRLLLRVFDSAGWVFAATLTGYAVFLRWPAIRGIPWLRWGIIGLILGIWLLLTIRFLHGVARTTASGRGLRPLACQTALLPSVQWLRDRSLWWTAAYVGGFFLLLRVLPR